MTCICHFVSYILPGACYEWIQCGFIPSVACRFSQKFFSSFRCRKLVLTKKMSYISVFILGVVGKHVGEGVGIWACLAVSLYIHWPVFLSICSPVHPYVCQYICISEGYICTFVSPYTSRKDICLSVCQASLCLSIHPFVSSSIACQKLYNCRPIIPVDECHCWSHVVSCMVGLSM